MKKSVLLCSLKMNIKLINNVNSGNMKKIIVGIMAVLFSAPSFAQFTSGGFSLDENSVYYGVRIGINFARLGGDLYDDLGTKVGMNLGGVIGLRLSQSAPVFLESGLYYTERGGKDGKDKASLTYLEIPILIKYGIQLSNDVVLLPYVGPYFSYGIAGKTKIKDLNINESSYDYFKHGDMGFKFGCGVEYNNLYAEAGYQIGVTNIAKDNPGDLESRGSAFFVNIGVNF